MRMYSFSAYLEHVIFSSTLLKQEPQQTLQSSPFNKVIRSQSNAGDVHAKKFSMLMSENTSSYPLCFPAL